VDEEAAADELEAAGVEVEAPWEGALDSTNTYGGRGSQLRRKET
jgi:hypothetical protein